MKWSPKRWSKRTRGLVAIGLVLLVVSARPLWHVWRAARNDGGPLPTIPPGFANDASRLNLTKVQQIWDIPTDTDQAEQQLAELLSVARREHLPVSIAGAKHSMGGHTIAPDGIVINMRPFRAMRLNDTKDRLHVQAGAFWDDIIPYLDERGCSVAVMQSNSSFSVGGSISVNCHGWQFDRPPIASTVESFRLMKADGSIVTCSRYENADLFSLVLGGYGLFGVILDVELRVVPNRRYRMEQFLIPATEALTTYDDHVKDRPDVEMVYARMSIVPNPLFREVLLTAFIREEGEIPKLSDPDYATLQRAIFRGSAESDYGKELRWSAETKLQPWLSKKVVSRNQLLNEKTSALQNRSATSTDILHEYFLPRAGVVGFVDELRSIIPKHNCDLLNVTVRSVNEDHDSFLRYADQPMIAFVMLFQQPLTDDAEAKMQALTREFIDSALSRGGRYYLPYRPHATLNQFHQAYPQAVRFFELKRHHDPDELFRNQFFRRYGLLPGTSK
jgi:FAD/FMN-containing dehydrogenase